MHTKSKQPKQAVRKKRYGHHHKQSKNYYKVYLPYLPMFIILILSFFVSGFSVGGNTLAYATEMSISNLLAGTNAERASNGSGPLTINSKLNSAAQAKADDMINRDYWSHNTPDGEEPWVFFDNAGYEYTKAGENLAYGFSTSYATIQGWMNSPSHKANLLDSAFVDVGFGFTNGSNFNNSGQETVVVAEYGRPQVLGSSSPPPPPPQTVSPPPAAPVKKTITATPTAALPSPAPIVTPPPAAEPESTPNSENIKEPVTIAQSDKTDTVTPAIITTASARNVSRIEQLTKGKFAWITAAVSSLTLIAVALMLFKHGILLRHLIRDSEKLIIHHPLFDMTLISLVVLGLTLLRTVGTIK